MAIQPTQPAAIERIGQMVSSNLPTLEHLLPADITMDEFHAATWLMLKGNPKLLECEQDSIMDALIKAATYGMLPGRDCFLIPFRKKATYVEGYKGILRALDRTGKVAKAFAHPKYANDHFELDYGMDTFSHRPDLIHPGKVEFYYGCIITKDGVRHVQPMTIAQVNAIKDKAPAQDEGPWITHYEQMARKTALKQVAKYVQLTPQYEAMEADDEARELTNIPDARARQTTIDITGSDGTPDTAAQDQAKADATPAAAERRERLKLISDIQQLQSAFDIHLGPFMAWVDASEARQPCGLQAGLVKAPLAVLELVFQHLRTHKADACTVLLGQQVPLLDDEEEEAPWDAEDAEDEMIRNEDAEDAEWLAAQSREQG